MQSNQLNLFSTCTWLTSLPNIGHTASSLGAMISLSECTAASWHGHTSQYLLALITAWCHRSGSNTAQHSAVSPPPVPVRSEVNYKVLHVCYKRLTPSSSVSDKCSPAVFAGKMRAAHANTQSSRSSKKTSPLALMYMYIMYLHTATPAIIYTLWHYIQPTPDLVPSAFQLTHTFRL